MCTLVVHRTDVQVPLDFAHKDREFNQYSRFSWVLHLRYEPDGRLRPRQGEAVAVFTPKYSVFVLSLVGTCCESSAERRIPFTSIYEEISTQHSTRRFYRDYNTIRRDLQTCRINRLLTLHTDDQESVITANARPTTQVKRPDYILPRPSNKTRPLHSSSLLMY